MDERISEPVSGVVELLQEKKDRALTQKWAVWLVKRDPEHGIKVRISSVNAFECIPNSFSMHI